MQLNEVLRTKKANAIKVADALSGYFRGKENAAQYEAFFVACAYTLYKAQIIAQTMCESNLPTAETVLNIMKCNENIYCFVEPIIKNHWEFIKSKYNRFSIEALSAFILLSAYDKSFDMGCINSTPISIINLSLALLNIQNGERVADFGAGSGAFLVNAFLKSDTANYYGVEIEPSLSAISNIRAELLGDSVTIEQSDMFAFAEKEKPFDRIFSNYPLGLRLNSLIGDITSVKNLLEAFPFITKNTSSDWIYNALMVSSVRDKPKGKAIGIMLNGSTWNSIDKQVRKDFVQRGFIETVIALPDKMFATTQTQITLIVLSHGNNSIRMIDARKICQKGRRQNEFSEGDIARIISALTEDSCISKSVGKKEIKENEYVLNAARYLDKSPEIESGVEFGKVMISITRGAHLSADQLDEMTSLEPTNVQFLKLSNIQDGFIDEKLPFLKEIDPRYQRYRLRTGDLLISKNGSPFRVAVAKVETGKDIIACTNLYIIRLDETKVNPHYLKAYFESEQGTAELNRTAVGSTLPIISTERLSKLTIPVPPLAIQQDFIERYLAKAKKVNELKHRLEKEQAELKNMFIYSSTS